MDSGFEREQLESPSLKAMARKGVVFCSKLAGRIKRSEEVGADVSLDDCLLSFKNALDGFHGGDDFALLEFDAFLSGWGDTRKSELAQAFYDVYKPSRMAVEEIEFHTDEAADGKKTALTYIVEKILSLTLMEKIELLQSSDLSSIERGVVKLHGTVLVDVPFICATIDGERCLILSIQSPIDAIYFPARNHFFCSTGFRFDGVDRLRKFFNWVVRNVALYGSVWKGLTSCKLVFLVRDKRPYHVLQDELSGWFEISESGLCVPLVYFARASFLGEGIELKFEAPEDYVFDDLVITNHRRADKDMFSDDYYSYLRSWAKRKYQDYPAQVGTIIWVSISGGEKRRWFEEKEALQDFVRWARSKFFDCHFFVDGWTAPLSLSEFDRSQISAHKKTWMEISESCGLTESEYTLFIGSNILHKIWGASLSRFFVSCAGTPSVWPSLICRVPGVVHNSKSMIRRVTNTYFPLNVIRVPDDDIEDVNEIGENIRWDKYSYKIKPERFLWHVGRAVVGVDADRSR